MVSGYRGSYVSKKSVFALFAFSACFCASFAFFSAILAFGVIQVSVSAMIKNRYNKHRKAPEIVPYKLLYRNFLPDCHTYTQHLKF